MKFIRRMMIRGVGGALASALLLAMGSPALAGDKASDAYVYPIRPGTAQWRELKSHDDMLKVTQLPEKALRTLSTEGLVETVLNYPLFGDMLMFNSLQEGFETLALRFNGLQALLSRKDAGTVLLARYREMDPKGLQTTWSLLEQGEYDARFTHIETLLAQDAILATLSKKERQQLLSEALVTFEAKGQYPEVYGQFGRERSALVMGRTLRHEEVGWPKKEATALQSFLKDGTNVTEPVVDAIVAETRRFLSGDSAPGHVESSTEDYSTTVYTPNGTPVPVFAMTYESSWSQIEYLDSYTENRYPLATRETRSSRLYNCHSYAWHSPDTLSPIWMDTPGDDRYWLDGSYHQIYSPLIGARISYASDDHSGILVENGMVRSKWGRAPRMLHAATYCPYSSLRFRYYTR